VQRDTAFSTKSIHTSTYCSFDKGNYSWSAIRQSGTCSGKQGWSAWKLFLSVWKLFLSVLRNYRKLFLLLIWTLRFSGSFFTRSIYQFVIRTNSWILDFWNSNTPVAEQMGSQVYGLRDSNHPLHSCNLILLFLLYFPL